MCARAVGAWVRVPMFGGKGAAGQSPSDANHKSRPPGGLTRYKKDWGTEHRSEPYPKSAEGKMHHPEYNVEKSAAPASATPLGLLMNAQPAVYSNKLPIIINCL